VKNNSDSTISKLIKLTCLLTSNELIFLWLSLERLFVEWIKRNGYLSRVWIVTIRCFTCLSWSIGGTLLISVLLSLNNRRSLQMSIIFYV
jgi:hypothetical protein